MVRVTALPGMRGRPLCASACVPRSAQPRLTTVRSTVAVPALVSLKQELSPAVLAPQQLRSVRVMMPSPDEP